MQCRKTSPLNVEFVNSGLQYIRSKFFQVLSRIQHYFTTSPVSMPCVKPEELTAKINGSHISTETKEILKLFMGMFSTIQQDRDNKIKDLDKKVTSFRNTTTALEK